MKAQRVRIEAKAGVANTCVWFDDRELTDVVEASIEAKVDSLAVVRVTQIVHDGFEIVADDQRVVVNVLVDDRFDLVVSQNPDGTRTFRAVPRAT